MNGPSRRWRAILFISLGLNLFLAGALAGGWASERPWWPGFERHGRAFKLTGVPDPRHLRETLPESDHELLRAVMAEHRPAIRERIGALRAARADVAAAIAAEPVARARLEEAFGRVRARETAIAEAAQAAIADLALRLGGDSRHALAALFVRQRKGTPGRDGD